MPALYPTEVDWFIDWIDLVTDMVAQDLEDLFDAAIAIEVELGDAQEDLVNRPWPPSGDVGTIVGRLFARGYLSKKNGGWLPTENKVQSGLGQEYDEKGLGQFIAFTPNRWLTFEAGWIEHAPIVFCAHQAPLDGLTTPSMTHYAKGRPWGIVVTELGVDHIRLNARDGGSGGSLTGHGGHARLGLDIDGLGLNNSRTTTVGVLLWALDT